MTGPITDLMRTLAQGLEADAASADALFIIAEKADATGRPDEAAAIQSIARMHCAKLIEYRARLDALSTDYITFLATTYRVGEGA